LNDVVAAVCACPGAATSTMPAAITNNIRLNDLNDTIAIFPLPRAVTFAKTGSLASTHSVCRLRRPSWLLAYLLERSGCVASFARLPEGAAMRVVLPVTGVAIRGQRDLGDVFGDVAGLAIEIAMRPGQRVARLLVVIKAPPAPIVRVMAERAVRPQAAFMMLVLVAGYASHRSILEQQRAMAFLAGHDGVATDQRKSRDVVIEEPNAAPVGLAMALLAANAQLAFVLVILSMA